MKNIIRMFFVSITFMTASLTFAQGSRWKVDAHRYQYDMTVYAALTVDDISVTDYSGYEVAAFVDEECRGVALSNEITQNGQTYGWIYLRIYSNVTFEENVKIRVRDKSTGEEIPYVTSLQFIKDARVGIASDPFAIIAQTYLNGDANSDGKVKEDDVQNIVDHILGHPDSTVFSEKAADVDHNGTINIADIVNVIRTILDHKEE